MGKIIAFMNQKGGVGKSTLLQMSSINWYINKNSFMDNKHVAVVDADSQQTTTNLRASEINVLKERDDVRFKSIQNMERLYSGDRKIMDIFSSTLEQVYKNSEGLKKTYNYVFLDTQGSAFSSGLETNFFSVPNLVVIPFKFDDENIRSTLDFVDQIIIPQQKKHNFDYCLVVNNILRQQESKAREFISLLKDGNYNVLDTLVFRSGALSIRFFDDPKGRLSTLVPRYSIDTDNFNNELEAILLNQ